MKTNVILLSPDRDLFGIKIRQESKSSHLNLSDLQAAYAVAREAHGWGRRDAFEVLSTKENAERIYYILEKQEVIKPGISGFMESVEKEGLTKLLKRLKVYRTTGRGANRATWCDPYIWVLVAMELNPMLYAQTVMWLADGLLGSRVIAGNNYRAYSEALASIGVTGVTEFGQFGKALNYVVFGSHQGSMRNMATADQLQQLADLEDKMVFAIRMGFVRDKTGALDMLRKLWSQRPGNPFKSAA